MTPTHPFYSAHERARESNQGGQRSWHIPAQTPFAVSVLRCVPAFVCAAVFCASVVAIAAMVSG